MTHQNYTLTFFHCLEFYRPRKIICFQSTYSALPLRFACGRIKEQRVVMSLTEYIAGFQNFTSLSVSQHNYIILNF